MLAANRSRTRSLPQPHCPPLVMGTSRHSSAADSSTAPTRSKRPREVTFDSGTTSATAANMRLAETTDTQNTMCQEKCSTRKPASGNPIAEPMPRVALIVATAPPTFSRGSSSRRMLMPIGIIDAPTPWNVRATTSAPSPEPIPPMTEPTMTKASDTSMIFFLPTMSARRARMGVATAPASSVAVTSHEVLSALVCSSVGHSGMSGMTSVCCSATTVPAMHRTAAIRL